MTQIRDIQPHLPGVRLPGFSWPDRIKASAGALLGIALTALVCAQLAKDLTAPWMVAPMGASAVLLFAIPASPLAQPWAVVGGNTVSALAAVVLTRFIPDAALAAGCAVGVAILAMTALRCLHPPGGAAALLVALGGADGPAQSWIFALQPVALNSLLLVLSAFLYHRLSGHSYPHRASEPSGLRDNDRASPIDRIGPLPDALSEVLGNYGEVLDVSAADLQSLFREVELRQLAQDTADLTCRDIMSPCPISVPETLDRKEVQAIMTDHRLHALPVIDEGGKVKGVITALDLVRPGAMARDLSSGALLARDDAAAASLVRPLADGGRHEVLIVDGSQELIGIVTQSDLVAALAGILATKGIAGTEQSARLLRAGRAWTE